MALLQLSFLIFVTLNAISAEDGMEQKAFQSMTRKPDAENFLPVLRYEPVTVSMGLTLLCLSGYDSQDGSASLTYWMALKWTDKTIKWRDYSVESINIKPNLIWTPDIIPFKTPIQTPTFDNRVVVFRNGSIIYVPQVVTRVHCPVVKPSYPAEERRCSLKLGSWTYSDDKLNLTMGPNDVSELNRTPINNGEWEFVDFTATRSELAYPCCEGRYVDITYDITIRRKDPYFGMSNAVPCAALGLIISLLYLLYPSNPARIITQALCLFLVTYIIISHLPTNLPVSFVPTAIVFYVGAELLALIAIIWSILAAVVWQQFSGNSGHESRVLNVLECLLVLHASHSHPESGEEGKGEKPRHPLSLTQRFFLIIDRLLCIVNIVLIFIFIALIRN